MRLRAITAGLALTALLAGACSGDDDSDASSDDTTSEATDDDPRTEDERAADAQAAEEANLTLADFEAGWEATPPEEDDADSEDLQADLADCLGVDVAELDKDNPSAKSPTFTNGNDEDVTSEVAYTATEDEATRTIEIMQMDELPGCYAEGIEAVLKDRILNPPEGEEVPDGLQVGKLTVNPMSFPQVGDESLAFRTTVPLSASGTDVDLYVDTVMVRVGRVGVTMTFQSVYSPFDSSQAEELTKLVVDRIPTDA